MAASLLKGHDPGLARALRVNGGGSVACSLLTLVALLGALSCSKSTQGCTSLFCGLGCLSFVLFFVVTAFSTIVFVLGYLAARFQSLIFSVLQLTIVSLPCAVAFLVSISAPRHDLSPLLFPLAIFVVCAPLLFVAIRCAMAVMAVAAMKWYQSMPLLFCAVFGIVGLLNFLLSFPLASTSTGYGLTRYGGLAMVAASLLVAGLLSCLNHERCAGNIQ